MKIKNIWITAAVILSAAAAALLLNFLLKYNSKSAVSGSPAMSSYLTSETSGGSETAESKALSEMESENGKEYVSPIDFDKLTKDNSDTCAWLEIPGSELSFPVVQHPTDNSYYLTHNFQNESSIYGAAFIEDYNQKDFSDMAAVIYGHNINNGEWFGQLQTIFTNQEKFEKCCNIKLYLPDEERNYRVFAAVPYDDSHILYYNDFSNENVYDDFIEKIANTRALNSIIDDSSLPTSDKRLLILSTCLKGDYSHRFLVLAYQH